MPQLLSDLELDEVSLVKNAANGKKKFLIYKSTQERVRKMKQPASKGKATDIQKAIKLEVEKALAGERRKTAEIRKELNVEKGLRRRGELAEFVKSKGLDILGPVEKTVDRLLDIEKSNLSKSTKKAILADLVQAAEVKKHSDIFKSFGSSQPAANTPEGAFEAAVQARVKTVQKSADAPKNEKVARAEAVAWVVKNRPELMAAIGGGA